MKRASWGKPLPGSRPSDRIKPSNANAAPSNQSPRTASKGKNREPPKSSEVLRLEALVKGLRDVSEARIDPYGGCFCQARLHSLSSYTPLCRNCGLILCELHQPFYVCPNSACSSGLLNPAARDALVAQLELQILDCLNREEEARRQAIRGAQEVEGAFPRLTGSAASAVAPSSSSSQQSLLGGGRSALRSHPVNQTHKVLSLTSKKHKPVLTSYMPSTSSSRSSSLSGRRGGEQTEDEAVKRIPAPSKSVEPIALGLEVGVVYIPVEGQEVLREVSSGSTKKGKKKEKVRANNT